jgi:hypothetical protein
MRFLFQDKYEIGRNDTRVLISFVLESDFGTGLITKNKHVRVTTSYFIVHERERERESVVWLCDCVKKDLPSWLDINRQNL